MIRKRAWLAWMAALVLGWPVACPAPLIYVPGEGWHYETGGDSRPWMRNRAKEQLEVAQEAYAAQDYSLAKRAARRTVRIWPFSDYSADAQFILAASLEGQGKDYTAFKAFQKLIQEYPKQDSYDEVVRRQFEIANRFLAGQWFRLWGFIPFFPSMEKTIDLYEQIIKNGPYSEVAPQAQMNIAAAYENKLKSDYEAAARASARAADRYSDRPIGVDALYKVGLSYLKLAQKAEYDQSIASRAIDTFSDFIALYPNDNRVPEARRFIAELRTEQARGAYEIARYYERRLKWHGASVYYNEVLNKDSQSKYAELARYRLEMIGRRQALLENEANP
jgi:outer membrane protein assembly factor BamD